MRKTREILRHILDLKLSYRVTRQSLGVSQGVISDTVHKARQAGLDWEAVQRLPDDALVALLDGNSEMKKETRPLPDWVLVQTELLRPGVTLELLHQEYLQSRRS